MDLRDHDEIHITRAARMAAMGFEPEAKFYLRRLALSTLRHWRNRVAGPTRDSASAILDAERLLAEGMTYTRASRKYRGGPVKPAAVDLTHSVWEQATNPHWPELGSHGVFVQVHDYHPKKAAGEVYVEVQILPGDSHRSQFCPGVRFRSRAAGEAWGKRMVTVGRAIMAATAAENAETFPVFALEPPKAKKARRKKST